MSVESSAPQSSLINSEVVRVVQDSPGYLRVTFDNPPVNLFDPEIFAGLSLLQQYVDEEANDVRVLMFESANPDFFFAHVDFPRIPEVSKAPGGRSLIEYWPLFSTWLSSTPVVSIAKVRGRTRGIGNEFVLANDLRFASQEKASFCQIEVGFGMVPGGGALEWLPRHVGRARALEIVLSADDFDARTAELYGLVNRALPDADLDDYVDLLARRIASFPAQSLVTTKAMIGKRQEPPTVEDLKESFATILQLAATAEAKAISAQVRQRAGGTLAPAERDLPNWYGPEVTSVASDEQRHAYGSGKIAEGFSQWEGSFRDGHGSISTKSGVLDRAAYTYASRFGDAPGANPEELLAAAHAACFNQALANISQIRGFQVHTVQTSAQLTMGRDAAGPAIVGIHLDVTASVSEPTKPHFQDLVERARVGCAFSKALSVDVTVTAAYE